MNTGRGYQGQAVLADGSIFTLGGSWSQDSGNGGFGTRTGELLDKDFTKWTSTPGLTGDGTFLTKDDEGGFRSDNHYWLLQTPTGKLFHGGPSVQTHLIDVTNGGSFVDSVLRPGEDKMAANVAMYDVGKILIFGGSRNYDKGDIPASNEAFEYDVTTDNVKVKQVASLNNGRTHANAVIAPNGNVIVLGGSIRNAIFTDVNAILKAEMYNPKDDTWTELASNTIPRNYHSACVLMKDARVFCTGGSTCGNCAVNHPDFEIFSPPYLFNDDVRPTLTVQNAGDSLSVAAGDFISVTTSSECEFSLVRLGVASHALNLDNRRFPLEVVSKSGLNYGLRVPVNKNVALPGPYYLFANDIEHDIPSLGFTVDIKA